LRRHAAWWRPHHRTLGLFQVFAGLRVFMLTILVAHLAARAEELHAGHPQDVPIHDRFYEDWTKPDKPTDSCCNTTDCHPTDLEKVGNT
jgi:hypothetical protein